MLLYLRRLFILALFGCAHGVLLWIGDILLMYAITGVVLLVFFRNRGPRTLLVWPMILIAIPIVFMGVGVASIEFARVAPPETGVWEQIETTFAEAARQAEADAARDYEIYANGNFATITAERLNDFLELLLTLGWFIIPPVLAAIALLSRSRRGARILAPLVPVGRMALSNYLLQSIVMTTLAYGYGFGLYGRIDLATGFLLAIVLYAVQIPLSNWWLSRFRFGPFEWTWRTLTYARVQPLRVAKRQAA